MLESDDDLDLLFVRYDPQKISLEQLKETVAEFEFEAEIRDDAKQ